MADAPSLSDASAAMAASIAEANSDVAPSGVTNTPPIEGPIPGAPNTEATPTETPQVTQTDVPTLDGIDLSGLDPDVAKRISDGFLRQQDYTRKTQEIAPLRKLVEEVGDLDKLRQSYDFVSRLESDPDFLAQVAQELAEYAKTTPEQPATALETPQGTDPALVKTVNELNEWRATQEQERINAELVQDWEVKIQTAEDAIRASNPAYTDADIDVIYKLLPAVDYDMFAAQETMEELRNRFVNDMVRPKLNHPAAANPVDTGSLANSPKDINDFAAAAAATRERLRVQGS